MMNRPILFEHESSLTTTENSRFRIFLGVPERLFDYVAQDIDALAIFLSHEIVRKPQNLSNHIRRIYLCYRKDWQEALFAALVDFLIVLDSRGRAIARRMILGSRSKLTSSQRDILMAAINEDYEFVAKLPSNRFSLLTEGTLGCTQVIEKMSSSDSGARDPLQLAQDAVEYSQLSEAMAILEQAMTEQPERIDLQDALLELYRSTHDHSRFARAFAALRQQNTNMPAAWIALNDYFNELSDAKEIN
ncbi:hypothetical protein [Methylotuvimicrobium sp. KM2]|uniref:type IV pilus assembly protein FimV n=1 Tax=Methylotuvimicrobium sp. KM2 TaxID=3133976 RepID=UPI003100E273